MYASGCAHPYLSQNINDWVFNTGINLVPYLPILPKRYDGNCMPCVGHMQFCW